MAFSQLKEISTQSKIEPLKSQLNILAGKKIRVCGSDVGKNILLLNTDMYYVYISTSLRLEGVQKMTFRKFHHLLC